MTMGSSESDTITGTSTMSPVTGPPQSTTASTPGATDSTAAFDGTTTDGATTTAAGTQTTAADTQTETGPTTGGETTTESGVSTGTTTTATEGTGTTAGGMDDTIYEIQDGTISTGVAVDVQGVVVTGVGGSGFFAQEPGGGQYAGVYVYVAAPPMVMAGDEVDIVGVTVEFNDLTEIDVQAGAVTPTGLTGVNLVPDVVVLSELTPATGEPWEGVLVRIEGAPLTVVDLPGFDEFDVGDGGVDDARIDNFLYSVFDFPAVYPGFGVGATFTAVQGPVNFTFGAYKVAPREPTDLEGYLPPAAARRGALGVPLPWLEEAPPRG
ncbi:MAG: hypothetical protein AAGF11_08810 [Myxococcota bacterium]